MFSSVFNSIYISRSTLIPTFKFFVTSVKDIESQKGKLNTMIRLCKMYYLNVYL